MANVDQKEKLGVRATKAVHSKNKTQEMCLNHSWTTNNVAVIHISKNKSACYCGQLIPHIRNCTILKSSAASYFYSSLWFESIRVVNSKIGMNRVQYSCILQSCSLYEPIKKDEEESKKILCCRELLLQHMLCVSVYPGVFGDITSYISSLELKKKVDTTPLLFFFFFLTLAANLSFDTNHRYFTKLPCPVSPYGQYF